MPWSLLSAISGNSSPVEPISLCSHTWFNRKCLFLTLSLWSQHCGSRRAGYFYTAMMSFSWSSVTATRPQKKKCYHLTSETVEVSLSHRRRDRWGVVWIDLCSGLHLSVILHIDMGLPNMQISYYLCDYLHNWCLSSVRRSLLSLTVCNHVKLCQM